MASREDTEKRRQELRRALVARCESASGASRPLPTVRTLAQRFDLSVPTVRQVIKGLVDDGLVHIRSTAGTFAGPHRDEVSGLFLVLSPYALKWNTQFAAVCRGFEERIAQLAGSSLILDWKEAHLWQQQGRLPSVSGVFELRPPGEERHRLVFPADRRVVLAEQTDVEEGVTSLRFDNIDGGYQAALHLLKAGHTKVAFLGLHGREGDRRYFTWSAEREKGWRLAMQERHLDTHGLIFLPERTPTREHASQTECSWAPVRALLSRTDITAIVNVNPFSSEVLTSTLEERGLPPEKWPAIVSFDDADSRTPPAISAVRLPWDKLGREAADLLWQRTENRGGPVEQHLVKMLLIPRLSCRSGVGSQSLAAPGYVGPPAPSSSIVQGMNHL